MEKPFVKANELFLGLLKENKQEGRGSVEHKKTLTEDKEKLFKYFENRVNEEVLDPKIIQQICTFNIVYYMGRHSRDNLRSIQKDTFSVITGQNFHFVSSALKFLEKNFKEFLLSNNISYERAWNKDYKNPIFQFL